MDELEKQLKSILDSPGELQRLASMAQSLLGGGAQENGLQSGEAADPGGQGEKPDGAGGIPPQLAALAQGLLGGNAPGGKSPGGKGALIDALAPYLGEKRRNKLKRAASMASAARLAEKLLAQGGQQP